MNELQVINDERFQIFSKENLGSVRTVLVNNEVWVCAKDVCDILEIKNVTQAVQRLDEDERSMFNIGRQGNTNFINESGLYNLILRSDKKEAKPFIKWITKEVIPAIRKTGMYANQKLLLTPSEMRLKIRYYDSKSKVFNSINRLLNNDHMTEELRNALTGNIKDILSNDDNLIQTRAQQDNEEWDRNNLTDKLRDFVKTYGVKDRPTKEAYEHFIKLYGVDITITKFSRELRKLGHDINAKNVNGRTKRVFVN